MIPLVDLKAQYQSIKPEIDAAIGRVLETGAFALGPAVADFEKQFAPYCGVTHAAGVNSGTSALHLALLALGIGPGDEVIAPAMTFIATVSAIDYTGARPVLVDVEPGTCTMDPAKIEAAITPRTKAILPVHLYGQCADMDPILAVAAQHGLPVVEDAAQAHGAEYKGHRAGSMGVMGCFSFYPGKNLGAYGEGGAVVTNNPDYDKTIRMLRDWGCPQRYHHDLKGFNYRLEGIQGAVLGVKMNYIEGWTEKRRAAAKLYREQLAQVPGVRLPTDAADRRHVYHVFAVFVHNRDEVVRRMQEAGVGVGIHYPIPVHLQKCFAELGYKPGDFPVAEQIGAEEMTLPLYPELTAAQVQTVVDTLKEVLRQVS
ncbi:MAG: DegT/DnrJ/EryC1/StrS family aminotransferase [Kiritimatiellae bacterium]|nr:DegT/DnrJ/EryC1/StrS family aminotransferase [Kiritimatiellia bacterium]MDD4116822.1 DegT/DnrJ/EryC1/StrS family aminotransferase [Kiritimatiellia bacterium]